MLTLESVLATTDDAGITVEQALDEIGYAGSAPVGRSATQTDGSPESRLLR